MSNQKVRIVNREVVGIGREEEMDEVFQRWVIPDLTEALPDLMATARVFRPVFGDAPNALYFTAEATPEQVVRFGSFIHDALLTQRSEKEVAEWYERFHSCLVSINRLSLLEVMTSDNPSIMPRT